MRLGPIPENLLEWIVLRAGLVPVPMGETIVALMLARTLTTATRLGVFDALAAGPMAADDLAARCGLDPRATGKLLFALAGARYLRVRGGRYGLAPVARRWLLRDSPRSVRDAVLETELAGRLMEHDEGYVRTGRPARLHEVLSAEDWELYQRGQRARAVYSSAEVARRTPVPPDPQAMLDVGGAHGYYSMALCRRHPRLRSTILDLPPAIEASAPAAAREDVGGRLTYRAGDALTAELGEAQYDLVFMANLVHHFDERGNRELMRRIARALRPGGCSVILEIVRSATPHEAGQIGALTDFYFAVTSASGTWSFEEMADWQSGAGLQVLSPIRLRLSPGYGLQAARKP